MLHIIERVKDYVSSVGEAIKRFVANVAGRIIGWGERYKELRARRIRHGKYIENVLDSICAYEPEQVDIDLGNKMRNQFESLENGKLIETIKAMSFDERKEYFEKTLLPMICNMMDVNAGFLGWFEDERTAGFYNEQEKGIAMNMLFLTSNDDEVLCVMVNTIIHECKHARQWDAVSGRNSHGYSDALIAQWKDNFEDYIQPEESDEGYYKQPVEWDARCFAETVVSLDKE